MTASAKVANEALNYEKENKYFEAFVKYLEATASFCLDIVEKCKLGAEQAVAENTYQRLKMIERCLDRAKAVHETLAPKQTPAVDQQHTEVKPRTSNAASLDPEARAKEANRQLILRHRQSISKKDYSPAERAAAETALQKKLLENLALAEQETHKTLHSQYSPVGRKKSLGRSSSNTKSELFGFNTLRRSINANNNDNNTNGRGFIVYEPPVSYFPTNIDPDSDIEAGPQLPKLADVFDPEWAAALTPKESTRQKVIIEFIHTERTHVGDLKVLNMIFYQPLKRHSILPENFVQFSPCTLFSLIFANLEEVLETHTHMNNTFKKLLRSKKPIENFGDVLLKFFDREIGENFKNTVVQFCQHQQYAIELIEERKNQDPRFNIFLMEAQSHPLAKNFSLCDRLLKEMQRITKYPLLIELIMKHTNEEDTEEIQKLERSLECSKKILTATNEAKRDFDSWKKLTELQLKVDTSKFDQVDHPVVRQFRKLDFRKFTYVHDGSLVWKQGHHTVANIHGVLLDEALVLLTTKGNRLILKFHGSTLVSDRRTGSTKVLKYCPVVLLNAVDVKEDPNDNERFFIYEKNAQVPPYELTARCAGERVLWLKHIEEQIKRLRSNSLTYTQEQPHSLIVQYDVKTPAQQIKNQNDSGVVIEDEYATVNAKAKLIKKLRRSDGIIFNTLLNKQKFLAEILGTSVDNLDYLLPDVDEEMERLSTRELTVGAITQVDLLTNLMTKRCNVDDDVNSSNETAGTVPCESLFVPVNLITKYLNYILIATV